MAAMLLGKLLSKRASLVERIHNCIDFLTVLLIPKPGYLGLTKHMHSTYHLDYYDKSRCTMTRCQDSSVARLLRLDPMVSGSSPTSAKLSHRVRRVASSL